MNISFVLSKISTGGTLDVPGTKVNCSTHFSNSVSTRPGLNFKHIFSESRCKCLFRPA